MIISLRRYTYEDLVSQLSKDEKIVVWACNTCIKFCDIGGRMRAHHLAEKLKEDGYNVIREENSGVACMTHVVGERKTNKATKPIFEEADVIIPLTCEDGYDVIAHLFPDKKVLSVTKTVGLGVFATDTGISLTVPFGSTGLEMNVDGYPLDQVAEKLGCYAGPYWDGNA